MKKTCVLLLLSILIGTSCAAQTEKAEAVMRQALGRTFISRQIVYKKIDTLQLCATIYYPDSAQLTRPAIIFFFGGGWVNGSPSQFQNQAKYFAARGLVVVLADYRVSSRNGTSPFEAVQDAKSAIRYVRTHAAELHVDPARIIGSGASAGGHLAAAADLTHLEEPGEDTTISSRPNALVLFNPVFNNGPGNYGYEKMGNRYREISPYHNIRKGAAPSIIFFGDKDKFVPVDTAMMYKQKMELAGSLCELLIYAGQGHGFFNYKPDTNNKYFYLTLNEADAFLVRLHYLPPLTSPNPPIESSNPLSLNSTKDLGCNHPPMLQSTRRIP